MHTQHSSPLTATQFLAVGRAPPHLATWLRPITDTHSASQHLSISASQHLSISASNHPSIPEFQHLSISASQHLSIPASQHPSISASHPSISASQHPSISSQHLSISAYQHPSILASQHPNIPASQHPNIPGQGADRGADASCRPPAAATHEYSGAGRGAASCYTTTQLPCTGSPQKDVWWQPPEPAVPLYGGHVVAARPVSPRPAPPAASPADLRQEGLWPVPVPHRPKCTIALWARGGHWGPGHCTICRYEATGGGATFATVSVG